MSVNNPSPSYQLMNTSVTSCPMIESVTTPAPMMCQQTRFFDRQIGRNIPLDVNPNLIDMDPTSTFASTPVCLTEGGGKNGTKRKRGCEEQPNVAKYQNRESPAVPANACRALTKKRRNGKMWIAVPDKRKINRWQLLTTYNNNKSSKFVNGTKKKQGGVGSAENICEKCDKIPSGNKEHCEYDPSCSKGGVGCNAKGVGLCRFCGFKNFPSCNSTDDVASTVDQEKPKDIDIEAAIVALKRIMDNTENWHYNQNRSPWGDPPTWYIRTKELDTFSNDQALLANRFINDDQLVGPNDPNSNTLKSYGYLDVGIDELLDLDTGITTEDWEMFSKKTRSDITKLLKVFTTHEYFKNPNLLFPKQAFGDTNPKYIQLQKLGTYWSNNKNIKDDDIIKEFLKTDHLNDKTVEAGVTAMGERPAAAAEAMTNALKEAAAAAAVAKADKKAAEEAATAAAKVKAAVAAKAAKAAEDAVAAVAKADKKAAEEAATATAAAKADKKAAEEAATAAAKVKAAVAAKAAEDAVAAAAAKKTADQGLQALVLTREPVGPDGGISYATIQKKIVEYIEPSRSYFENLSPSKLKSTATSFVQPFPVSEYQKKLLIAFFVATVTVAGYYIRRTRQKTRDQKKKAIEQAKTPIISKKQHKSKKHKSKKHKSKKHKSSKKDGRQKKAKTHSHSQ